MNQILFLDFDGVLHPTHLVAEDPFNRVALLEAALDSFSPQIVISSSWRFTHSIEKLRKLLPNKVANLVIGATASSVVGKHARYQEILNYIGSQISVTDWRALDDSYWEFPSACKELIRCNPNTGITSKEVQLLREWLLPLTSSLKPSRQVQIRSAVNSSACSGSESANSSNT